MTDATTARRRERMDEPDDLGPISATPDLMVTRALAFADVSPDDIVYDLGCNDGRVCVAAALERGARSVGIEIDPGACAVARERAARANALLKTDVVRVEEASAFDASASEATVKQLRADLQFEKSNATKFESKLIAVVKEKEALEKAHQAKDAKIEQLQNRVDEQVKKLGAASSELQSLAATKRKDADLSAREHELKVSYAALKAREASCASREKALALKKDVGARTEASAALPSASMTPTLATTPASTSKPPISRFADIARRYVFTPGLNPRANDTPTKTTPLSAKSKQLFAAVVDKAQSAAKASASKAERAKTATAVGMFNALQSVVGFKDGTASTSEPKKIAAPALTPSKKTLETQ